MMVDIDFTCIQPISSRPVKSRMHDVSVISVLVACWRKNDMRDVTQRCHTAPSADSCLAL